MITGKRRTFKWYLAEALSRLGWKFRNRRFHYWAWRISKDHPPF